MKQCFPDAFTRYAKHHFSFVTSQTKAQSRTRKASKMHRDGYVAARPSLGARHIPILSRKPPLPANFFVWYLYLGSLNNLFTRIDCDF